MADIKRIVASLDGAIIAFVSYLSLLIILGVFGYDYHQLPAALQFIIAPWENVIIFSKAAANIAGMPPLMALANLATYTSIGYIIDWIRDPYK